MAENPKGDYQKFEDKRWSEKDQKIVFRHMAAFDLLSHASAANILDIGCGDGVFERYIQSKDRAMKITGVDMSPVAVENAKRVTDGVQFEVIDTSARRLPFPDAAFDCALALDVLEHLFLPNDMLQEMGRVSSKYVVVGVPNFSSFPARLQMLFGKVPENNKPKKGHVYWFNYNILRELFRQNDLEILRVSMNYQLQNVPLVGGVMGRIARLFPNLLPLSYVVLAKKK